MPKFAAVLYLCAAFVLRLLPVKFWVVAVVDLDILSWHRRTHRVFAWATPHMDWGAGGRTRTSHASRQVGGVI